MLHRQKGRSNFRLIGLWKRLRLESAKPFLLNQRKEDLIYKTSMVSNRRMGYTMWKGITADGSVAGGFAAWQDEGGKPEPLYAP